MVQLVVFEIESLPGRQDKRLAELRREFDGDFSGFSEFHFLKDNVKNEKPR